MSIDDLRPSSHHPDPSRELRREQEGFLRQFLAHERRILGFIVSLVPNRADAENIFQQTATTLWAKYTDFDSEAPESDFAAWALSVARIEVMRHRQAYSRSRVRFSDELVATMSDEIAADEADLDRRASALTHCLNELPDNHRELIRQRYELDLRPADIAGRSGRSLASIYKMLARIHGALIECVRTLVAEGRTQ